MKKLIIQSTCLLVVGLMTVMTVRADVYVKPDATGDGTGSSWENAISLSDALLAAVSGDVLHLASGEYIPSELITGGASDFDATFEIKANITLVGGYPENPVASDEPSKDNPTIFNGEIAEGYNVYHVVAITAPQEEDADVIIKNIGIKGGKSATSGSAINVNGTNYVITSGGAMIVGGGRVNLENCRFFENIDGYHCPGLFAFNKSNIVLDNCVFENNISTGNVSSMWIDNASIEVRNSSFLNNKASGVSGIQLINSAFAKFYNTTISNNVAGYGTTTASRGGAGIYVRNNSTALIVNCTIEGNQSNGNGAGISLHNTTVGTQVNTVDVINSTIVNNDCAMQEVSAGIFAITASCNVNVYNSIISGNTNVGNVNPDVGVTGASTVTANSSIVSDKVLDAAAAEVTGLSFNPATMLDALADNGGDMLTVKLLLDEESNPAFTNGMEAPELVALANTLLTPSLIDIVQYDQIGNERDGRVMGALAIKTTPPSGLVDAAQDDAIQVKVTQNGIEISSMLNDRIAIYNAIGQRVFHSIATSESTFVGNLLQKGNVYIVLVNDKSKKVLF